ncbi:MAG: hypothetical protein COW02_03470 [Comamonadaceae bacterium CG12_big_fil_rev_8_21_14_0_65_59_15]|nr:MAG: hypothetical protein COW02_03470 [Comamonadaceae bacterium CG12_big_fil_rev_8_21_14_0_65_59_15]
MILYTSSNQQIRADLIKSAVLRSDLSPVPVTLETDIQVDDDLKAQLAEGKTIKTRDDDVLRIVKSTLKIDRSAPGGDRQKAVLSITAMLDRCHTIAFVRTRAVVKENQVLSGIYRACGATLQAVDADFAVPRFTCPIGDAPSFHIARVLQEEGGVVRWRKGKLQFFRLADLFKQKAIGTLPNNATTDLDSGFVERHEAPSFFSLNDAGAFVFGDVSKPRAVRYAPFKNALRLRNMTKYLVQHKVMKTDYAFNLCAGDLIDFAGDVPLCVITAAHVFENNDGGQNHYTRLWLGMIG